MEIALDSDGELPRDVIAAAYIASRAITVGFVISPSVSREEIDCVLDPLVATTCGSVRGVRYFDLGDARGVQSAIQTARFVVAVTPEFRERCASSGIVSLDWPAALSAFEKRGPERVLPCSKGGTGAPLHAAQPAI